MFKITCTNVDDRISNRIDRVIGTLNITDRFGGCWNQMRYLTHQMCFAFARKDHSRTCAARFKRVTFVPVQVLPARPQLWLLGLAASAAQGARSAG